MRVLFLLDALYAPGGPTLRFGRQLAAQLARMGCQVRILENVEERAAAGPYTDADGVCHLPFSDGRERALYRQVAAWRAAGLGVVSMALRALLKPALLWTAFRVLVRKRSPLEASFRRRLRACWAADPFDAAVSVSAPHYTAMALAFSGLPCVKAAYMVDPFASAATMRHVASAARERRLYAALDVAFITDVMAEQGLYPGAYREKTVPLHFPAIRPPLQEPCADDVELSADTINCVFAGNLYLDIRDPSFTLALFARLPQNIRLWLLGEGYALFPPEKRAGWKAALGERLAVRGPVSQQAAWNVMQRADVLVSIGNSDPSQLPSKVFDYLSTGRPVLNLYKLEHCPTLPFFGGAPLVLNLRENDKPTGDQVAQAAAFIEENAGKRRDFELVRQQYADYTPGAVAARMLKALQAAGAREGGA